MKMERLKRLDRLSRDLDEPKYAEFTRARQVNFLGTKMRHLAKFNDWLYRDLGGGQGQLPRADKSGLEVFSYFAYETVGHLVDLAMIVRKEELQGQLRGHGHIPDEVSRATRPGALNPSFPMVQVPACRKLALVESDKSKSKEPESPLKKRLKSGEVKEEAGMDVSVDLEAMEAKDQDEAEVTSSGCVQPRHILEAYRRLGQWPSFQRWYQRVDARHQRSEAGRPLLIL